ncbi:glycosyltransferase [Maribellus comscasis]|uniref:Glycosyltransferase n=1 Tax=Maribellus comscasis TaxID=2681766 RepID=A0A6I6JZH7_9BACT|nr:glycosyltransferase family 2 protein [Maribellus comscasis]QGY46568.1 glycosyltransferase [Maribellus comscasis]
MESNFKVSIIIPTYNQEKYIGRTIESAISQDYSNIEIIIADDQSTDKTEAIARYYENQDKRIIYFRNRLNIGRVANYKKALNNYATGEYVINLDGDDLLLDKTFISEGIKLLSKYPECNLIVGCKQSKRENGKLYKREHKVKYEIIKISGVEFVTKLFSTYQFAHVGTIYSRSAALSGEFYEKNIISSDMESILRLALKSDILIYNKIVAQWNYTGYNESTIQKFDDAIDNIKWIQSVGNELRKHIGVFQFLKWRIKMKYRYLTPINESLKYQKFLKLKQFRLMLKYRILLLFILSRIKKMYNKLNQEIQ